MNKAYNKITWQNKPSTATPLNQTNLNEMSNALDTIDDRVIALDSGKVSSVTVTNTLPTGDTIATITVDGTATNIKSAQVEVDDTPSATSENPLQNKAIYEMLNNLLPEETVQGNPIAISDASGLNAKACSIDLLPIQDLHGYDSPWVGGAGKNKLTFTEANIKAQNPGLTWTNNTAAVNGGTFTILTDNYGNTVGVNAKGTFTAQTTLMVSDYMTLTAGDLLNGCPSGSSSTYGLGLDQIGIIQYSGTDHAITSGEASQQRRVYIRIASGQNLGTNGVDFKPMLRLSSVSDNSFVPYSNICPISGRNSVKLVRTGKNKFDENYTEISTGNKYLSIYVGNGTYTMSTTAPRFSGGGACLFFQPNQVTGGASTSANGVWSGQTRTVTSTDGYVTITYRKDDSINPEDYNTQIEVGSTATAYEPYQGETVTVSFGQTVYGGTLDVTNGKLPIDRAIVTYVGNEGWYEHSSGRFYVNGIPSGIDISKRGQNDLFECNNRSYITDQTGYGAYIFYGSAGLYCSKKDANETLSDFTTALGTTNMQVTYPLATPIELTLTPEEISLLKGNNVVSTDGDNINLVYSADIGLYIAGQLQNS